MKWLVGTAALAAGFVLAACGASKSADSLTITGPTTTTITDVRAGQRVVCALGASFGPSAAVPAPGNGVTGIADASSSGTPAQIQLTRDKDGSLTVACSR